MNTVESMTGTLLIDTPCKLSHPATASPTNEVIDNTLETIEYKNIRGHIVSKIRKEVEPIIAQQLKTKILNL